MHDNRIPCYSVKVKSRNELGRAVTAYYLVRADSEIAAVKAVKAALPDTWEAVEASLTAVRPETVEALDLHPGVPRQI